MIFNQHSDLNGKHAFLSASSYSWLNYDISKLETVFVNDKKRREGTELHDIASALVVKRIKVANLKKAFNMFVNDAIGFNMESEKVLYYSDYCFGTADAISFNDNFLRIHDLKTGFTPTKFAQLDIYVALFCLEYNQKPGKIQIEQRIYQGNEIRVQIPDPKVIASIMKQIIMFTKHLESIDDSY